MEFYRQIPSSNIDSNTLKDLLVIGSLPKLCASIDSANAINDHEGDIYCLWGAFDIRRDELRMGIRISLLNCPHALAWTLTLQQQMLVIHCTIDDINPEQEFIESIDEFMDDWLSGMSQMLNTLDTDTRDIKHEMLIGEGVS